MFSLLDRAYDSIYQVIRGLKTVAKHSFRLPTTKEYPDQMPPVPPHFRGRLALNVNPETNEHLCISCRQCERVCPDKCIEITAHKSPITNKLELIDFKIDHGLCMFCGLCTEVCPTDCIINTNDFEMSDYTRESLVYDIRKLTLTQAESSHYFASKEIALPKPKPVKAAAPAAAAKPAAPAAAAKPAAPAPEVKTEVKTDAKPEIAKASEAKTEAKTDAKPETAKASEAKDPETKAETAKASEAKDPETKPETVKASEAKDPETKAETVKATEPKTEAKASEAKSETAKTPETKDNEAKTEVKAEAKDESSSNTENK